MFFIENKNELQLCKSTLQNKTQKCKKKKTEMRLYSECDTFCFTINY